MPCNLSRFGILLHAPHTRIWYTPKGRSCNLSINPDFRFIIHPVFTVFTPFVVSPKARYGRRLRLSQSKKRRSRWAYICSRLTTWAYVSSIEHGRACNSNIDGWSATSTFGTKVSRPAQKFHRSHILWPSRLPTYASNVSSSLWMEVSRSPSDLPFYHQRIRRKIRTRIHNNDKKGKTREKTKQLSRNQSWRSAI